MDQSNQSNTQLVSNGSDQSQTNQTPIKVSHPTKSKQASSKKATGQECTIRLDPLGAGGSGTKPVRPAKDPELDLLQLPAITNGIDGSDRTLEHSTRNAVLVTGEAE